MAVFSKLFTALLALSLLGIAAGSESPVENAPAGTETEVPGPGGEEATELPPQPPPVALDFPKPLPLSCPSVLSKIRMDGTCSTTEVVALPPLPEEYHPWTHVPFCAVPLDKPAMTYCSATSASFGHGRGISIAAFINYGMDIGETTHLGKKFSVRAVDEVKYEKVQTEDKGIGLFVKKGKAIKAGEVIIVDYPTLTVSRDLYDVFRPEERQLMQWMAYLQLPEAGREVTMQLDHHGRYEDDLDNLITKNSLPHTIRDWKFMSVFPEVARVNHRCVPNSYYRYNDTTFALELFALKDIGEGEEITYSYVDPNRGVRFADRYKLLGSQWGFECDCPICKSAGKRAASDKRRTKINKLRKLLSETTSDNKGSGGGDANSSSGAEDLDLVLEYASELLDLYEAEEMVVPRAMTAEVVAYTHNQLGEADEAARYGALAVELYTIIAGEDSNEVRRIRPLVQAPKLHGSWKPRSDAGDVVDEERLSKDSAEDVGDRPGREGKGDEDAMMEAVRAAMAKAKKVAREEGVNKETEDALVEEAVKAAIKKVQA